jgi:four helix bundle protein
MLPFQHLDVYRCALDFSKMAHQLAERCPPAQKDLVEQLRRAALSIPLNIAEGNGKIGRDCRRFYQIARGSVMECGAIYDVCSILGIVGESEHKEAMILLDRMTAMLTKMTRA